jgi:hypothetical protein
LFQGKRGGDANCRVEEGGKHFGPNAIEIDCGISVRKETAEERNVAEDVLLKPKHRRDAFILFRG